MATEHNTPDLDLTKEKTELKQPRPIFHQENVDFTNRNWIKLKMVRCQ
jgi:hypothetical protein